MIFSNLHGHVHVCVEMLRFMALCTMLIVMVNLFEKTMDEFIVLGMDSTLQK
jgi:hypothetical protein